jgi:hypothetical protein
MHSASVRTPLRQIPAGIWILGFVSLLMDRSSELIHSLLPLFMVLNLGVGAAVVGLYVVAGFCMLALARSPAARCAQA